MRHGAKCISDPLEATISDLEKRPIRLVDRKKGQIVHQVGTPT